MTDMNKGHSFVLSWLKILIIQKTCTIFYINIIRSADVTDQDLFIFTDWC